MATIKNPTYCVHRRDDDNNQDPAICGFSVQFTLPVDNPVDNVLRRRVKGGYVFEVPINTPSIHNLTLTQLLIMSEEAMNIHTVHNP
jgi:hypothetical protein